MKKHLKNDFEIVKSAVDQLVDFIKPTFGPSENRIVISDDYKYSALDDGVSIAKDFELENEFENAIIKLVKEASQKTNDRVGDGTTGSLIILQELLNNPSKDLKDAVSEAKEQLLKMVKKVETKEELKNVALVSYNNPEIAKVVSDIVFKVGPDGVITVEEGNGLETTSEVVNGLRFERGFVSPYMISDFERMETILVKPYVVISNSKITTAQEIMPILEKIMKSGRKDFLIISEEIEGEALALLIVNKIKGVFNAVAVKAPGFGDHTELLEDIAILTDGQVISEEKGLKLSSVGLDLLGEADKVVINKDSTTIIGGKGNVEKRIEHLKSQLEKIESEYEKGKLQERIAKLSGGIAVIKVGAPTESAMKTLKYKVEDSVNATKLAFKSGVVKGAGQALLEIKTSNESLNDALKAPARVLKENIEGSKKTFNPDESIVDPVEVLIAAIESAASIASLLISTKGIIVEVKEKLQNENN